MKTVKLYDIDSHMKEFDAVIVNTSTDEKGAYAVLDQTAFFPEGGGQYADIGTLGGAAITDVQEQDGEIRHYIDGALTAGERVHGILDWEIRFNRMQHHSGEHIVSGLVHQKYGYENVGFHLTDSCATLDFSGELTKEQLDEIELLANRAVWANTPVSAVYPDPVTLASLNYRSKLDLTENVRIVTFPGSDICACCAPHVNFTGEIGCIKLVDSMRHRGGTRVTLYAGKNALADYADKYRNVHAISALLSAKQSETAACVSRLHNEYLENKRAMNDLKKQLMEYKVSELSETDGHLLIFEENIDVLTMRGIANKAVPKCGGVCIVFSGNDAEGYSYIAASSNIDLRAFEKPFNTALSGKGGGSPEMIQGKVSAARIAIEEYMQNN